MAPHPLQMVPPIPPLLRRTEAEAEKTQKTYEKKLTPLTAVLLSLVVLLCIAIAAAYIKYRCFGKRRNRHRVPRSRTVTFQSLGLPPRELPPIAPPRPYGEYYLSAAHNRADRDVELGNMAGSSHGGPSNADRTTPQVAMMRSHADRGTAHTAVMRTAPIFLKKNQGLSDPRVETTPSETAVPLVRNGRGMLKFKPQKASPPLSTVSKAESSRSAAKQLRDGSGRLTIRFNTEIVTAPEDCFEIGDGDEEILTDDGVEMSFFDVDLSDEKR